MYMGQASLASISNENGGVLSNNNLTTSLVRNYVQCFQNPSGLDRSGSGSTTPGTRLDQTDLIEMTQP